MLRSWGFALAAAAALAPASAAAEWREAATDHFIIYADAPEKWLHGFAERLEKFDSGMRRIQQMDTPPEAKSNRLVIYVVANGEAAAKLCGPSCPNVTGFYVPRIGGSIAFTPRSVDGPTTQGFNVDQVLFHEYTHHFLLANTGVAHPRWLNEGFAEFNSTAQVARDGSMCFGAPAQHRAYALLEGQKMPVETVLDPGQRIMSLKEGDVFYGRSWLLLHMLLFEETRRGQLAAYLKLFNSGKGSIEAAREAFGDLKLLDKDIERYLARRSILCRRIAAENLAVGAITLRTLTPGEAATMPVRIRSQRGVRDEEAKALVPDGRKAATPFAADPGAQEVLARIEFDAGNWTEAEAAADRALAADPRRREAMLIKGRVALERLEEAASDEAKAWTAARAWFIRANQLDTNAAEPLYWFFMGFIRQREQPTKNAGLALERAYQLSPQDFGLGWMYAQYLLNSDTDRTAEARAVLLPLAYDPHQHGENRALRMIGAIDRGAKGQDVFEAARAKGDAAEVEAE